MMKSDFQHVQDNSTSRGAGRKFSSLIFFSVSFLTIALTSCTILSTRPVQQMSDTSAAIRAAKEVQADTLAPELYRQANEWFFRSKNEYKFKNFKLAREYSDKARRFAEDAEFEALRNGGNRSESAMGSDPLSPGLEGHTPRQPATPTPQQTPYAYPTPTGTPADALPPAAAPPTPPSP